MTCTNLTGGLCVCCMAFINPSISVAQTYQRQRSYFLMHISVDEIRSRLAIRLILTLHWLVSQYKSESFAEWAFSKHRGNFITLNNVLLFFLSSPAHTQTHFLPCHKWLIDVKPEPKCCCSHGDTTRFITSCSGAEAQLPDQNYRLRQEMWQPQFPSHQLE